MAADKNEVMTELMEVINTPVPESISASGRPIVGYLCSYIPTELLMAAGIEPLRLKGVGVDDSSTGDAYLSHLDCSFASHVVSAVVDGAYEPLSGEISCNTCDHVRRAYDAIEAKSDLDFHGYLAVPRGTSDLLYEHYISELRKLSSAITDHFGGSIDDGRLSEAIRETNAVRDRMARIDELRAEKEPRITGAEALTAGIAARSLPADKFIELADRLIGAAENSDPIQNVRARVILTGGELDDPRFVRVLESQGAHVAGDLLCYGVRGLGRVVDESGPPLNSIAKAYLEQVPCARMMGGFPRYYEALEQMRTERQALGVVFQRIKFCQIWSSQAHNLMHRMKDSGTPLLVLEREYGTVSTGQIKTRIQAFLEKMGV